MDSGTDRWGIESSPEERTFQTIVVVSVDAIVCAGISTLLGGMAVTIDRAATLKGAADLIFGSILGSPAPADPILVILHWTDSAQFDELAYQQCQQRQPPIPVLVIGQNQTPPPPLPGLSVLWGKSDLDRLQQAVRQLARGEAVWWLEGGMLPSRPAAVLAEAQDATTNPPAPGDWLKQWLQGACQGGTRLVEQELQHLNLSIQSTGAERWVDRQILQGQQRELKLVHWLLQQGMQWGIASQTPSGEPQSGMESGTESGIESSVELAGNRIPQTGLSIPRGNAVPGNILPGSAGLPTGFSTGLPTDRPTGSSTDRPAGSSTDRPAGSSTDRPTDLLMNLPMESPGIPLEHLLFDRFTAKLTTSLRNVSQLPLEIEGLNLHKCRELLILILHALGDRLTELRHSEVTPEQLSQQHQEILGDLWQETVTHFFGQYTIVSLEGQPVNLVSRLLAYREQVDSFILAKIPLWMSLLEALLFQEAVPIDGSPYRCESPEALHRLEQVLDNLVLQVANATVHPLLNECSRVEVIKHTYFHPRLLSTRQIERFRNDLSWKYRIIQSLEEPRNIYESRFALLVIQSDGIHRIAIYAPRQEELQTLTVWQQTIPLGLELRDALAPRLQSLTRWLGQGVIYVLTHILGRAIGLIGRGIVQGLGQVWSDRR